MRIVLFATFALVLSGCAQVGRSLPEAEMTAKGDYLAIAACVNDEMSKENAAAVRYAEFSAKQMARISFVMGDGGISSTIAIVEFRPLPEGMTRISGDMPPAWIDHVRSKVQSCEMRR